MLFAKSVIVRSSSVYLYLGSIYSLVPLFYFLLILTNPVYARSVESQLDRFCSKHKICKDEEYKFKLKALKKAKKEPNNYMINLILGYLYYQVEDYNEAIRLYSEGIILNPNNVTLYIARSDANALVHNKKNLVEDYTNIIRLKPELFQFYRFRGDIYRQLGQEKKAIEDYVNYIDHISHGEKERYLTVYLNSPARVIESFFTGGCGDCGAPYPYTKDSEYILAQVYYNTGVLLAKENSQEASRLFQKSLDIFTKLGNEEWQQKVRIALDSTK